MNIVKSKLKFTFLIATVLLNTTGFAQVVSDTTGKLTWSLNLDDGTLTVMGKGIMPNYNYSNYLPPWYSYRDAIASVTIKNGVTSIGDYAFSQCSNLTSVTIPVSITTIGNSAFRTCSNLVSITIPNSVITIDDNAFFDCNSLATITLPNNISHLGKYCFYRCSNLTTVSIPDNITRIENYLFYQCDKLTTVLIPSGVTNIGSHVFYQCGKLSSMTIPDKVTSIGDYAFSDCVSLTTVTIPPKVTSIGIYAFGFCNKLKAIEVDSNNTAFASENGILFNKAKTTLIQYPSGKSNVSYIVPNSVTTIGTSAFRISRLVYVTIPNSVTTINDFALSACRSLASATIGNSVTSIGYGVFCESTALKHIYVLAEDPPMVCNESTFLEVNKNTCILHVPIGCKEKYASADGWREFLTIEEDALE